MGILKDKIKEVQTRLPSGKKDKNQRKRSSGGSKAGSPEVLEKEAERFSQYINDESLLKIIDLRSGLKHGVHKVGSKRDINDVLGFEEGQLFYGATDKIKKAAAKKFVKMYVKKNLIHTIKTKSKDVIGKKISRNIYLKNVSYMRGGKEISFLQARNLKTGKIISLKVAKMLMGRSLSVV